MHEGKRLETSTGLILNFYVFKAAVCMEFMWVHSNVHKHSEDSQWGKNKQACMVEGNVLQWQGLTSMSHIYCV